MLAYCFCRILILWIMIKGTNPFVIESVSLCYGNTHSAYASLECGTGEVILVRNTRTMAKLSSTGCPVEMIPTNELTMPGNCCINEAEDCGTIYTGSAYKSYYARCHGKRVCASLQASWVDIVDLNCNQSLYLPRTNYMTFTYSCIPTTFIKSPCEGIQTTNNSVFLWNGGYPSEMSPGTDSCACAAEISCNSTIVVTAIDLRFQDSSGTCLQSLVVTEDDEQTTIGCDSNNNFLETTVFTSTGQFITFEIANSYSGNGGNFWIQVSGQDEAAQVTLSCGPSSISQAESTQKPVCGQEETTTTSTTTITTPGNSTVTSDDGSTTSNTTQATTLRTTTTSLNEMSTTATHTGNGTTTSITTITSPGNTTATSNDGSTTSNTTQATTLGTTTRSLNETSSTATHTGNGINTTTTTTTVAVNGTTLPGDETSTSTESSANMTGTTRYAADLLNTTSSDALVSAAVAQTQENSGSPLVIIIPVVTVVVIIMVVVIILIVKREKLKKRFCPNKVSDDATESNLAEYATMPNPLLTDSASFLLIMGRAATSTYFPELPSKKPNQLEPLSSRPVVPTKKLNQLDPLLSPPQIPEIDMILTASMKYRLPKIEGIQQPLPREKSSISAHLLEEHHRNPFPTVDKLEGEARAADTRKPNDEGAGLSHPVGRAMLNETVKERHTRKKKKRMVDRLNRINIPTNDGRSTGLGFGASSVRF